MDLDAWHDFHVITGGSAAALVGLIFVVISVAPEIGARSKESVRAFISPTVVFYSSVLVLSAVMTVPGVWISIRGVTVACIGAGGVLLMLRSGVQSRMREHQLGIEDLLFYLVFPLFTYAVVVAAGVALVCAKAIGLVILGAAIIALLAISLRNAWDLVIFTARKANEEKAHD